MKISIICGSHRENSQSTKISKVIEQRLLAQGHADEVYLFDLVNNPLPLWEGKIWDNDAEWQALLAPISEELASSDAFVVVCPEWHGMAPAGLKNFFLMWGNGELAHKPALLVTVSSADGGSYPIAELRMSSYKNNRIVYLPEHLIIRFVEKVFNEDPSTNSETAQPYFDDRMAYCLNLLKEYAGAFRQIRASGAGDLSTYTSGM
jgi:NAD(P)H-dependent FMN reductase